MKKNYTSILSALSITAMIYWIFYAMMPQSVAEKTTPMAEFSTKRALAQVEVIAKAPHYVGSANHETVANYLEKELLELGLETTIQEGYTLSDWGNLVKSKNILARIKGSQSSKALLLLSHYDSAPHSKSFGASDDGSGIATILEGIRAFLHNKTAHKNDIVILFSDAEELGLNGAALFVTQNKWAKDIGFVLNFEARGSSGPSYMLMEVNKGNAQVVKHFTEAGVRFPVSNSLMYSIYKMLPNDTDLTVFREQAQIQGLNFAFIDNHFNYHTQQDNFQNLSPKTLAHQGTYLIPLLHYFSNANLSDLNSDQDSIYFNTPFNFVSYPFSWRFPLLIFASILFLGLLVVGFGKRVLKANYIGKGFVLFFSVIFIAVTATFLGWRLLQAIYPQYQDILQGFTYNGHSYIAAFVFLSIGICFFIYRKLAQKIETMNYAIAPLLLWIIINAVIASSLPGAGFFIIPVFSSLIMLTYFIITQKTNKLLYMIFCIPSLVIFIPFITTFPIGLGLKILPASALLVVLVFGLLIPVLGTFYNKLYWSFLMFAIAIGFFINAGINSSYAYGKAKPNSLVYVYDVKQDKAVWATYDVNLDEWTKKYLGNTPKEDDELNRYPMFSKYNSGFTYTTDAPKKQLALPEIVFLKDAIIGNKRFLKIKITSNRKVNRYDIFADPKIDFYNFTANGSKALGQKDAKYARNGKKILSYYVVNNEPLEMEFNVDAATILNMDLFESSFDLMENPIFNMTPRASWMMPTPFVLNDAVVVKQKIKPELKKLEIVPVVVKPKAFFKKKKQASLVIDTLATPQL